MSVEHHDNCQACAMAADEAANRRCPKCTRRWDGSWSCPPCGVQPCECQPADEKAPETGLRAPQSRERRENREAYLDWVDGPGGKQ